MTEQKTIQERANDYYLRVFDDEMKHLLAIVDGDEQPTEADIADGIEDDDAARQRLEEMPYSITKYATYHQDEQTEWLVELAGGGPAARLVVRADMNGEVDSATFEFCDWFQPWTAAENQDSELVERFARIVGYYGE